MSAVCFCASANLAEHKGELKGEVRLALPSDIGRSQNRAWLDVAQDVTEGRLHLVLADKIAPPIPLQLVYLQTDYPSHKIRRTIEFLVEKLSQFSQNYPLP
ncbi:hypothetical protein [Shewanella baltica]|uniref:hypothetical protein n=1 Tax=Shewanella baltica TaxID=62322 RepID=UPI0039B0B37D